MADIQESSSSSPPPHQPDDISLFLHQILLRSSSSSPNFSISPFPDIIPPYHRPPPESSSCWNSISAGNTDNDPDEYDCQSEEGFELHPPRNSSKRSRAAEVHNLSEKRRRSKINEKMKALQKLIPNSNKTDKASMLDEAIEYLKQLQLQVQMLTMRNGSSLYPSGLLQHNHLSHIKMSTFSDPLTTILPAVLHQEQQQHHINDLLTMSNQQLTLEGDDHNQLGIQNHLAQSEDSLHHDQQQLNMISDFQSLFPLNAKGGSNFKDDGLEACILRRPENGQDDEMPSSTVFPPHLSGSKRGRRDLPKI